MRGLIDLNLPVDALAVADQAIDTAHRAHSLDAMIRALDARLFALMHVNEHSEVIAVGTSLVQAAESAGDVVLATRGRMNTGSTLNILGMFEEAQLVLERALVDARARKLRILEAFVLHNLGMSYARLGHIDDGIEHQRQAARIADETGAARLRIHARTYETMFLVWRGAPGDLGGALAMAKFVCDETRHHPALQTAANMALARVQLARRAVESAVEAARDAHQRLALGPVEEWEEYIRLTLIEALLAAGELEEADATLQVAFDRLVERARLIRVTEHRRAFLTRNDEVGRVLQLARDRLGLVLPALSDPPHGG